MRLHQNESLHPFGLVASQGVAGPHPHVVAAEREAVVTERGHHPNRVTGKGAGVVSFGGFVGPSRAARIDGDDAEVGGQRRHEQPPRVPRLRPPRQQQQRRPVAPDDGMQAQPSDADEVAGERLSETRWQEWTVGGRPRAGGQFGEVGS